MTECSAYCMVSNMLIDILASDDGLLTFILNINYRIGSLEIQQIC